MLHLFGILKSVDISCKEKTRTKETLNLTSYKNKLQFECFFLIQYYARPHTRLKPSFSQTARLIDWFQGLCTLWFGGFATSPLASVFSEWDSHRGTLGLGYIQLLHPIYCTTLDNFPGSPRPNKESFFRMIHVIDSRSYQSAKFGWLGLPGTL